MTQTPVVDARKVIIKRLLLTFVCLAAITPTSMYYQLLQIYDYKHFSSLRWLLLSGGECATTTSSCEDQALPFDDVRELFGSKLVCIRSVTVDASHDVGSVSAAKT